MALDLNLQGMKEQIQGLLGKKSESNDCVNPTNKSNPLDKILGKYLYKRETMLGVDITPHYVRVCQMKNIYDKWTLNNLASTCMESQFTKADIAMNPDVYVENLKDLITKNNIKTKKVSFALPTSSSVIQIITMPAMDDEDFAEAASLGALWESYINLNGSIGEYHVQYKILRRTTQAEREEIEKSNQNNPLDESTNISIEQTNQETPQTQGLEATATPEEVKEAPIGVDYCAIAATTDETATPTTEVVDAPAGVDYSAIAATTDETEMPATEVVDAPVGVDYSAIEATADETAIAQPEEIPEIEGDTMDILFVATKLTDIFLYSDILQRAGLTPLVADIRCLSLKHAYNTNRDLVKEGGSIAFMEFGPDDNYLFIVNGDDVELYNIEITEQDKAMLVSDQENDLALKDFVSRFAAQTTQMLQKYEEKYHHGGIRHIYVSSCAPMHVNDASSKPVIQRFIDEISVLISDYKITDCNYCGFIDVPEEFNKRVNAEGNISAWAGTVGLATRKVDVFDHNKSENEIDNINLNPENDNYKNTFKNNIHSYLAMALIFIIAGFAVLTSLNIVKSKGKHVAQQINELAHINTQHSNKILEIERLKKVYRTITSLDGVKSDLPSNQEQIIMAYRHITSTIPEGVWLEEVNYKEPNELEIIGNSIADQNIIEFVKQLNEGNVFEKIAIKNMEAQNKKDNQQQTNLNPLGTKSAVKNFKLNGMLKDEIKVGKILGIIN